MRNLATIAISLTGACFVYAVPVFRFGTSLPKAGAATPQVSLSKRMLGGGYGSENVIRVFNAFQPREAPPLFNHGINSNIEVFGGALEAPKTSWYHASPQKSQAKKLDVESLKLSYFANELSRATQ